MKERIVYCEDAIVWLKKHTPAHGHSFVSSLPDYSEFPRFSLEEWKDWFKETATLIMSKCPDDGVSIFFQSDIKIDGVWVDKGFLVQRAAQEMGHELIWHKIVCRAPAGTATFGRPSFSHLLCFSKKFRPNLGRSWADVVPDVGEKTWQRGMGLEVCLKVGKFLAEEVGSKIVFNPFCGEGSMLAAAELFGLEAVGVEKSPKRAEKARRLRVSEDRLGWSQS